MANWHRHVAAAAQFFQDVERAMSDNCIRFDEVTLCPWQSNGGRSNGATAHFYRRGGNDFYITLYEYWNSDELCLQFHRYQPDHMLGEKHDTPHLKFGPDRLHIAMLAVQIFLIYWFGDNLPKDMYYTKGFGGIHVAPHAEVDGAHNSVFDRVMAGHMSLCEECDTLTRNDELRDVNGERHCKECKEG